MLSFFSYGDWFAIFIVCLSNVGISKPGPWQYCAHGNKSLVFPFQGVPPSAQHSLSPLPRLTKWTYPVFSAPLTLCSFRSFDCLFFFLFWCKCSWEQMKHTTELLFLHFNEDHKLLRQKQWRVMGNLRWGKGPSISEISLNKVAFLCPQTGPPRHAMALFVLRWLQGNTCSICILLVKDCSTTWKREKNNIQRTGPTENI